jgi:hypothetical protein
VNCQLEETTGHPLSTAEAGDAVDEVINTLLSTGHVVNKSTTDQVCCHLHRSEKNQLKNDVYFWDLHNQKLMKFYCRKGYKNGSEFRIEIFYEDRWKSLSDYVVPFYQLIHPSSSSKYEFNTKKNEINIAQLVIFCVHSLQKTLPHFT